MVVALSGLAVGAGWSETASFSAARRQSQHKHNYQNKKNKFAHLKFLQKQKSPLIFQEALAKFYNQFLRQHYLDQVHRFVPHLEHLSLVKPKHPQVFMLLSLR